MWGEIAERQGRPDAALARFEKAVRLGFEDPRGLVRLGRLLIAAGRPADAEPLLRRAIAAGAGTPSAEEARRLLDSTPGRD